MSLFCSQSFCMWKKELDTFNLGTRSYQYMFEVSYKEYFQINSYSLLYLFLIVSENFHFILIIRNNAALYKHWTYTWNWK